MNRRSLIKRFPSTAAAVTFGVAVELFRPRQVSWKKCWQKAMEDEDYRKMWNDSGMPYIDMVDDEGFFTLPHNFTSMTP